MKKAYFVESNGYDFVLSDDGTTRRFYDLHNNDYKITRNKDSQRDITLITKFLESIEDDSSWECYDKTVEELTEGCKIWVKIDVDF